MTFTLLRKDTLILAALLTLALALHGQAATFTVTNTANSGAGSLRQAVLDANAAAGADFIVFDASFNSPQTITLASVITINGVNDTLTITGPGANLLTISGNNLVRIFTTSAGEITTITGITFTQAVTGAIAAGGILTVSDCALIANTNGSGGAITGGPDALTVTNCTFSDNTNTGPGVNGTGGAALSSNAVSTMITNSTFSNNSATSGAEGGAIRLSGGTMTITGSTFTGNTTTSTGQDSRGGAIALQGSGQLTINDSLLTGNSSTKNGGAIYYQPNSASQIPFLAINNSTIANNTANTDGDSTGSGGGLFLTGTGSVTIARSTISGNQSITGSSATGVGGGIDVSVPTTITDSTISGNIAGRNGGGIYASTSIDIVNSTIVNNTATINGGGVQRNGGTVTFRNTIVADNIASGGTSPDLLGTITSNGFNLFENTTGATFAGDTSTNITGRDPNLGPLQNNGGLTFTHALLGGSPATDKGSSSGSTTDQRGLPRPFDSAPIPNAAGGDGADIGAFEVQLPVVVGVVSRKVHGSSGTFEIDLLSTPPGIECRNGGASGIYQLVVTFANPVSVAGISVMSIDGLASGMVNVTGASVTVDLTAVANAQTLGVTLLGVNDGVNAGDVFLPLGVLVGDTNNNGSVSAADIAQIKGQSGQTTTSSNFRTDVTANGNTINASDISLAKTRSGTQLP